MPELSSLPGCVSARQDKTVCFPLVAAALAVLVLLSYINSFQAGFAIDNQVQIIEDQRVHELSWENVNLILTQHHFWPRPTPYCYRPLTTLSLLLNYAVFGNGERPAGYHWINLLLHWGNAFLVFLLVWRLTEQRGMAFFAGAIYAVHPCGTEAVTNIIGRADLLATAAVVGGLLLHIKTISCPPKQRSRYLLRLTLLFVIGLLSKETSVVLLGVLVWYDLTYRLEQRHPRFVINLGINLWHFFVHSYVALLLPLLGFILLRANILGRCPGFAEGDFILMPQLLSDSFWVQRLTAIKVMGRYIGLLLWPETLSADYSFNQVTLVQWPFQNWEDWQAGLALAVILAWLAIAILCYRRQKTVFFFTGFFFITFLPTSDLFGLSSLFGYGLAIMADRYLYTPSIGLIVCAVIGVYHAARWLQERRSSIRWSMAPVVLLSVVVLAFGARTYVRNEDWKDSQSIWRATYQACPNSLKALLYGAPQNEALRDRVLSLCEEMFSKMPDKFRIRWSLGTQYRLKAERVAERSADGSLVVTRASLTWYQKAIDTLAPAVPMERDLNEKSRQKQLRHGLNPADVRSLPTQKFYADLAECYLRLSRFHEALEMFEYMRVLAPQNGEAMLGIALAQQGLGQHADAAATVATGLELKGLSEQTRRSLSRLHVQLESPARLK